MAVENEKQFSNMIPSHNMSVDREQELKSLRPHQSVGGVEQLRERVLAQHSNQKGDGSPEMDSDSPADGMLFV